MSFAGQLFTVNMKCKIIPLCEGSAKILTYTMHVSKKKAIKIAIKHSRFKHT